MKVEGISAWLVHLGIQIHGTLGGAQRNQVVLNQTKSNSVLRCLYRNLKKTYGKIDT